MPDDFPLDDATPEELRDAYAGWQEMCRDWDATHETSSMQALLDDPVAVSDTPWDPATDPL